MDLNLKYSRKAVRDIYLSSDIGRESPFDPFKDRTVTRFMARRDELVPDGIYFAEKQTRRLPCVVNYNVIPHLARTMIDRTVEEGGIPVSRKEDEAFFDRGYQKPSYIHDVSFTRGQRFDHPAPRNHVQLRKMLMEERAEAIRKERDQHPVVPRDVVQRPDCSHAPTLGTFASQPAPSRDPAAYTLFPFEKASLKQKKSDHLDKTNKSLPLLSGVTGTAGSDDEGEEWNQKRRDVLAKHGLAAGGRREMLRAKAREERAMAGKGVLSFQLAASREAPVSHQPRGKEGNDLLYAPKYDVTTREVKRYADVKLDKYAKRPCRSTAVKDHVDSLLTMDYLTRFYAAQRLKERNSPFGTPDQPEDDGDVCHTDGRYEPLTALDDYALHPPTPPQPSTTRKFRGTPDIHLFADRFEEPMAAILGGDRRKYEKQARTALRKEGIL